MGLDFYLEVLKYAMPIIIFILGGGLWRLKIEKKREQEQSEKRLKEIEKLSLEIKHLKDIGVDAVRQVDFYAELMKLVLYNSINDAVDMIFTGTKADRFLVLVARNGADSPKQVDVVLDFYRNKNNKIDAVKVYTAVQIDEPYVNMLRQMYFDGFYDIDAINMREQILKSFYKAEKVRWSRLNAVDRVPIDKKRAMLIFTSTATHQEHPFSIEEKAFIDLVVNGQINHAIKDLIKYEK